MKSQIISSMRDVGADEWDALAHEVSPDNPFIEHAFLALLEETKCVGPKTPWRPQHLVLRGNNDKLIGAMPAYLRTDSYGEYIFDWGWAKAAASAGLRYYPKVTSAIPFVPATGPRLLATTDEARLLLGQALIEQTATSNASSAHVLFCLDQEATLLAAAGMMRRASLQFHWRNARPGWKSFDAFLEAMKHDERKQIRRERRRVVESGVTVEVMRGSEVPKKMWPTLFALYTSTSDRKWGSPYLTKAFFEKIGTDLGERALVVVAREKGSSDVMAMTLSFEKGRHIYGRHWGCTHEIPGLHFELCYYRLIDRAIARGCTLVEAGAQGEHKLKRGFLPVVTHSVHSIVNQEFARAIERFLVQERNAVLDEQRELAAHSPFKDGAAPDVPLVAGL